MIYTDWMHELVGNAPSFQHFIRTQEALAIELWTTVTERMSLVDAEELKVSILSPLLSLPLKTDR